MIHILIAILGVFITIFFVIGTHEAAHFLMARAVGVKVLRFSIGFGKALFRWHDKSGTEYVFALIPLGGYVKMLGEDDHDVPPKDLPFAYNRQPFYKKFLIVLAGPATNILCAFLLYWLLFTIGFVTVKPIIGSITPHSIAANAGMQGKQEIVGVDGSETLTWNGAMFRLLAHIGDHDTTKIETRKSAEQKTETYSLDITNWHMNELTPDPLTSLGIIPYDPPIPLVIAAINEDSPAAQSDLKIGDKILAINHTPVKNWLEIVTFIQKHPDETFVFNLERSNKKIAIHVSIGHQRSLLLQKTGYLGIGPAFKMPKELLQTIKYDPFTAFFRAGKELKDITYFNLILFGKMITGKLSLESLGGPITIFETASDAINYGFIPFIGFLAFLSLSIGIINFFPIPGLDGGHLFMQIVELIIRRPIPEKVQLVLFRLGFLFIILILMRALVNDILRLS